MIRLVVWSSRCGLAARRNLGCQNSKAEHLQTTSRRTSQPSTNGIALPFLLPANSRKIQAHRPRVSVIHVCHPPILLLGASATYFLFLLTSYNLVAIPRAQNETRRKGTRILSSYPRPTSSLHHCAAWRCLFQISSCTPKTLLPSNWHCEKQWSLERCRTKLMRCTKCRGSSLPGARESKASTSIQWSRGF